MSTALIKCQVKKMLAWLPGQSPDVWHAVATGWNWDVDFAPLKWIVKQPNCDAATAQFIFWMARLDDARDAQDLASDIADRWSLAQYRTARFSVKGQIQPKVKSVTSFPPGIDVPVDGPEEIDVMSVFDEGIPRDIVISCFEDCGLSLPAWLKPKESGQVELDQYWTLIMQDGIADESQRRAMWENSMLLRDMKKWRTYVDSEQHSRLSAHARALIKEGRNTGDRKVELQGEEVSKKARAYLIRMQKPFDVDDYPEFPRSPKRTFGMRIFGSKPR